MKFNSTPKETERDLGDLRLSPLWIGATIVMWGAGLAWLSDHEPEPFRRTFMLMFALACFLMAGAVWFLTDRWELIGRWTAVLAAIVVLEVTLIGSSRPVVLGLFLLPTALAVVIIGMRAASAVVLLETVLLYGQNRLGVTLLHPDALTAILVGLWAILVALLLVRRPTIHAIQWAWHQTRVTQRLLDEARTHNANLDSALDGLVLANRQLDLLTERLIVLRAQAEEAQNAKATFMAKVSHELRTPLNMIIGLTDLLVQRPEVYGSRLPPALFEDLKIVHRNCAHLSSMIDDVLDLSQTESGRLTLYPEWIDLADEVQGAAEVVYPLFQRKQITLEIDLVGEIPDVFCDGRRIRQVILNLLSNAARHSERGHVVVQAVRQERRIEVSVADNGPGIAPADQKHIFEPFYQGASETGQNRVGSGLGLSICKQFVELHGGHMWLESELGQGSTFYLELPIAPPEQIPAAARRWVADDWVWKERNPRPVLPERHRRPRVLVYDETGQLRTLLDRRSDELDIFEAATLEQVTSELARWPTHLFMVNTATREHLLSLVETAGQVAPDTPITGCVYPSQAERYLQAGAVDYLTKPVMRTDLEEAINALGHAVHSVLVVDDDPDFGTLITRMIQTFDPTITIQTASDGRQAVEAMQTMIPDLVFLDLMLPHLNGWQVLEKKRNIPTLQDVPVILVTSQDLTDQPSVTPFLVTRMGESLSVEQTVRCALGISNILLAGDN